ALLLGAWHRVVGSVEIGDQNTVEASQCVLDQAPLARLRVEVDYLADRSKHPDVTDLAVQPDSCFICMNYVACCHGSEDLFSSFLVVFGSVLLESTHDIVVHLEPKESIQGFSDRTLGDEQLDDLK